VGQFYIAVFRAKWVSFTLLLTHQQGYRSCLGIMRLGKKYGTERLEAACQRALLLQACSYKSLESILNRQLDRQPLPDAATESAVTPEHDNIRGPHYYH
jgi:hypothetical protein